MPRSPRLLQKQDTLKSFTGVSAKQEDGLRSLGNEENRTPPQELESDPVNHPRHYQSTRFECIDIIDDLKLGFYLGNVMKYIWRHRTIEDLKKARWYLDRFIAQAEDE